MCIGLPRVLPAPAWNLIARLVPILPLQKYMVGLFVLMTIIAIPAMVVFAQGSRMPRLVLDPVGMSQLSLGNTGDPLRSVYVQDPDSSSLFASANATITTDVWGWGLTSVGTLQRLGVECASSRRPCCTSDRRSAVHCPRPRAPTSTQVRATSSVSVTSSTRGCSLRALHGFACECATW